MQKYKFRKYSPQYQKFFQQEKEKLIQILGPKTKIEHIGSTAVSGLGGKGIIDILIGVNNFQIPKQKLEQADYEFRAQANYPERLFFRIDYLEKNKIRRVHLHLTKLNSSEWKKPLKFRDYLIQNPELQKKYTQIKKQALKISPGDGKKYREHKKEFIDNVF